MVFDLIAAVDWIVGRSKLESSKFRHLHPDEAVERALNFDIETLMSKNPDMSVELDMAVFKEWFKFFENAPRKQILEEIVSVLIESKQDSRAVFEAIILFCQMISRHYNNRQLLNPYNNDIIIHDPLILIQSNEMRCGHIARLTCDLFDVAGFETRLLQLADHVSCEVKLDGKWACVDNDMLGGGEYPVSPSGDVLSVAELSENPDHFRKFLPLWEKAIFNEPQIQNVLGPFPSVTYFYFSAHAYKDTRPMYFYKSRMGSFKETSSEYGWDSLFSEPVDELRMSDEVLTYTNGACDLLDVTDMGDSLAIKWWAKTADRFADLSHFNFRFSRESRNWNFNLYKGKPDNQKYWTGPVQKWTPERYLKIFEQPASDHVISSPEDTVVVDKLIVQKYPFCTCEVVDHLSLKVGRRLNPNSPEYNLGSLV